MPASTKKQILHEPVLRLKYTAQDDPSTPAPRELDMPPPVPKVRRWETPRKPNRKKDPSEEPMEWEVSKLYRGHDEHRRNPKMIVRVMVL